MTIKELFEKAENGTLTIEQYNAIIAETGAKFVDLSEGNYVSKQKYTDELNTKDARITELTTTIGTRDTDLKALKKQLADAGTDAEKLTALTNDLSAMQDKYKADTKALQAKLDKQAYEFAVKDFANTKKFSSNAAKRDFINSLIAKELQMENGKIMGAEDFVQAYSVDNADAFLVEQEPTPAPQFVAPLNTNPTPKPKTLSELMKMKNDNPGANIGF